MSRDHRYRNVTIKGFVCPTKWSKGGEIERVSIMTWDEHEHEVVLDDIGRDLIEFPHRAVIARCDIVPSFRKRKLIVIKSFSTSSAQDN